jgi:tetratricopeptide (TPR) repeat protein
MDHRAILQRIRQSVDQQAYLPYADAVDPRQREAMLHIQQAIQATDFDASEARALAQRYHEAGAIDAVMLYSALHVIAASPQVRDYVEAARLVAQQELAAYELGGPGLAANLASVDRHRGVIAFLVGQNDVALDYFSRAFERQHTAGNLANVLATLVRLGDEAEARELLAAVRTSFPPGLAAALRDMIAADPDLALLRDSEDEP